MQAEKLPMPAKRVNEYVQQQLRTQLLQQECLPSTFSINLNRSTITWGPAIFMNKLQHQEKKCADKYWKYHVSKLFHLCMIKTTLLRTFKKKSTEAH